MRAGAGSTKSGIQVVSTPYCTCYHRGNSGTGSTVTTKFALPLLRNLRETKHFGLLSFFNLFFSFFFFFVLFLFAIYCSILDVSSSTGRSVLYPKYFVDSCKMNDK